MVPRCHTLGVGLLDQVPGWIVLIGRRPGVGARDPINPPQVVILVGRDATVRVRDAGQAVLGGVGAGRIADAGSPIYYFIDVPLGVPFLQGRICRRTNFLRRTVVNTVAEGVLDLDKPVQRTLGDVVSIYAFCSHSVSPPVRSHE